MDDKYRELEHINRVLQKENAQLTERAEDSTLQGLISQHLDGITDPTELLENVLEQISVLKSIPFCTCATRTGTELHPIALYAAFTNDSSAGYPISLDDELLDLLLTGPQTVTRDDWITCHFPDTGFSPTEISVFPFQTRSISNGIFLFMDHSHERDRMKLMMPLLGRVIEMTISKWDHIHLLKELSHANEQLTERVEQHTAALIRTNAALEKEIENKAASEAALQETKHILLTVLNSIDSAVHVCDLSTYRILFSNKLMAQMSGPHSSDTTCFELRGQDSPCDGCSCHKLLDKNGKPVETIEWEEQNTATKKWYMHFDRAIRWTDGRFVRLHIATDITNYKKIEAQLYQAKKHETIGRLAGGIAHDFNNLLMAIQGQTSLIAEDFSSSCPGLLNCTRSIEDCTQKAASLTHQLLGYAREGKYEVKATDLNALVTESTRLFGRTHKEIIIHKTLADPAPIVSVDQIQIGQVLLNLCINAGLAMPDGGDLYIETGITPLDEDICTERNLKPGRYAHVSITDTGCGMASDILTNIFDPFFTTRLKDGGSGMGLASADGIIKNHAGTIIVTSKPGHGSTFIIYLPISSKKVTQHNKPEKNDVFRGVGTVLLVDDEEFITTVGEAMLRKIGFQTHTAQNGEDALRILKENRASINLVIMDLIMPGMNGGQLFDAIHALRPELPVILSSGYAENDTADKILQRGCNAFIKKPYNLAALSQIIKEVLDQKNSR